MKKITVKEVRENARKEKEFSIKNALLNHLEWQKNYFERKNLKKTDRQAYEYLKLRLENAHDWEFEKFHKETMKIELTNWLLKNFLTAEDAASHVFFKINDEMLCCDYCIKCMKEPVKSNVEAKKLYYNALHLLSRIFSDYASDQALYC